MLDLTYPPHVTLMACDDLDMDELRKDECLPCFVREHPPIQIDFPGFGIFTGLEPVVYLSITRTPALTALHHAFWQMVTPFARGFNSFYLPEAWVPHATLNLVRDPGKTGANIQALINAPRPAGGMLVYLQIIDLGSGMTELFSSKLGAMK